MEDLREAITNAFNNNVEEDKGGGEAARAEPIQESDRPGTSDDQPGGNLDEADEGKPVAGEKVSDDAEKKVLESSKEIKKDPEEESRAGQRSRVDRAPQSWKAETKAIWGEIPLPARQEIMRREAQLQEVLHNSTQQRKFVGQIHELCRPYEARLQELNATPVQALEVFLKADRILSAGTSQQKASYMASLIKDYGVDLEQLDDALSSVISGKQGDVSRQADGQTQMERIIDQKMAPVLQFFQQQQDRAKNAVVGAVQNMASDAENFPHFFEVRKDMADLMELSLRRGSPISPAEAYRRAVLMNPELQEIEKASERTQAHQQSLTERQQRVSKAMAAGSSVSGAPGSTTRRIDNSSLRSTIESVFDEPTGRV